MLPVACTVRPPDDGELLAIGEGLRANGFVPVGVGCRGCIDGCICCWGANSEPGEPTWGSCIDGRAENGDPVLCFANGLVADLLRPGDAMPEGLLSSFGSAMPVATGGRID